MNVGVIVGLAIAGLVLAVAIILLLCYCLIWRQKGCRKKNTARENGQKVEVKKPKKSHIQVRHPSTQGGEIYVVRHHFEAENEDQLTLNVGRFVEVLMKDDSGWWKGRIDDECGLLPSTHIRPLSMPENAGESGVLQLQLSAVTEDHCEEPPPSNGYENRGFREEVAASAAGVRHSRPKSELEIANECENLLTQQCRLSHASNMSILPPPSGYSADTPSERGSLPDVTNHILDKNENYKSALASGENSPVSSSPWASSTPNANQVNQTDTDSLPHRPPDVVVSDTGPDADINVNKGHSDKTVDYGHFVKRHDGLYEEIGDYSNLRKVNRSEGSTPHVVPLRVDVDQPNPSGHRLSVAMYRFEANSPEQLPLAPNEAVELLEDEENGWVKCRNKAGLSGWCPSNYLRQAKSPTLIGQSWQVRVDSSVCSSGDDTLMLTDDFDVDSHDITGIECLAVHAYKAQQEGDLSFEPGDVIIVVEQLENGWWRGLMGAKRGWFPGAYVEMSMMDRGVVHELSPFQTELPLAVSSPRHTTRQDECDHRELNKDSSKQFSGQKVVKLPRQFANNSGENALSPTRPAPLPPTLTRDTEMTVNHQENQKARLSKRVSLTRPSMPPPAPPMPNMEYISDMKSSGDSWDDVGSIHSVDSVSSMSMFQKSIDSLYDSIVDELDGEPETSNPATDHTLKLTAETLTQHHVTMETDTVIIQHPQMKKDINCDPLDSVNLLSDNILMSSVDDSAKPLVPPKPPRTTLIKTKRVLSENGCHSSTVVSQPTTDLSPSVSPPRKTTIVPTSSKPSLPLKKPKYTPPRARGESCLVRTPMQCEDADERHLPSARWSGETLVDPVIADNTSQTSLSELSLVNSTYASSDGPSRVPFEGTAAEIHSASTLNSPEHESPSHKRHVALSGVNAPRSHTPVVNHSHCKDEGVTPKASLQYRTMNLSELRVTSVDGDSHQARTSSCDLDRIISRLTKTRPYKPSHQTDPPHTAHLETPPLPHTAPPCENYGLVIQAKDVGHTPQVMLQYKDKTLTSMPQSSLDTTPRSGPPQSSLDTTPRSGPPHSSLDTTPRSGPPQSSLHTAPRTGPGHEANNANGKEGLRMRRARLLRSPHGSAVAVNGTSNDFSGQIGKTDYQSLSYGSSALGSVRGVDQPAGHIVASDTEDHEVTNPVTEDMVTSPAADVMRFFSPTGYVSKPPHQSSLTEPPSFTPPQMDTTPPPVFRPVHPAHTFTSHTVSQDESDSSYRSPPVNLLGLAAPRPYRPLTFVSNGAPVSSNYFHQQNSFEEIHTSSIVMKPTDYAVPLDYEDDDYEGEESVV